MAKHRTQLFLEQDQYESLADLADRQQCSISELVRDFVNVGLDQLRERKQARLEALETLTQIRRRVAQREGRISEEPVAAARAERELQQDAVLRPGLKR
ncbi:MAG: hypothetical protein SX243_17010 [Acidobacteriota bacterium]|nr:hypothetical protein [Acidobacteriota bacterium]